METYFNIDIEARRCINCKHYLNDGTKITCNEGVIQDYNFLDGEYFDIKPDFGCNLWVPDNFNKDTQ